MFEIDRVLAEAEAVFGDRASAMAWLDQPLSTFHDHTPRQLIAAGRADDVLSYLASIESGFVG